MKVSVVVPTFGRPPLLRACLGRLVRQTLSDRDFEIVVVDDGSPLESRVRNAEAIRESQRERSGLRIRYLWRRNAGPAAARNAGWRVAQAPVIAFTDDDTEPAPDWLREGVLAIEGFDAVAGRIVMPLPANPTDYERDAAGLADAMFVTANCFVRREQLVAVDGFDERFRLAWREDADLQFALQERGARIGSAPHAVVVHPIRPATWGVSLRQQRKVLFDALLYKKHPRAYRALLRPHPPWRYYLAVLALAAAIAAVARGSIQVATIAFAIWSALTAEFFWRRIRATRKDASHVLEMLATSALIPALSVFWRLIGAWRFRVPFV